MPNADSDPPFKVKALFEYISPHEDDLNFAVDQIITVTGLEDDGWYTGEYADKATGDLKQGLFPRNFVERIVVELPPRPTRSGGGVRKAIEEQPVEHAPVQEEHRSPPSARSSMYGSVPPPAAAISTSVKSPLLASVEIRPPPPPEEPKPALKLVEEQRCAPASPPPVPRAVFQKPPQSPGSSNSGPSSKTSPPEKPVIGSFKDRLAKFNQSAAAPIAPYNPHKPPVNFIKKPFVAPPPSKNAYIPPAIQHVPKPKRDEETIAPPREEIRRSGEQEREEDDGPKIALKDRIALLQTQQLNPMFGGAAKKKPPPPKPKKLEEPEAQEGQEGHERKSYDGGLEPEAGEVEPVRVKKSVEIRRDEAVAEESGDADVSSAAGTIDEAPASRPVRPTTSHREDKSDDGDDEGANDDTPDAPDSEEEEIDPELAKKLALRERMAKMSGGMGMHGMFGPPIGIPMGAPMAAAKKKKPAPVKPTEDENDAEENDRPLSPQHPPPIPILPFAMPRVQSPPVVEKEPEVEDVQEPAGTGWKISEERPRDEVVDVEDIKPRPPSQPAHPHGPRPMPGSPNAERTVPMSPPMLPQDRPAPPPIPMERPAPPPPPATEAGPPPPPPPPVAEQESPSEGSVSDDEMSMHTNKLSVSTSNVSDSNRGPPPLPPSGPPSVPSGRPPTASDIVSPTSPSSKRMSTGLFTSQTTSPTSPATGANKRASYQRGMGSMPPIPFGIPFPPSAVRPPPPPPPAGPPIPTRQSIDEGYRSPGFGETSGSNRPSDTEEEVTEYEADYDTDLANKDAHRFALKAQHGKEHGAKDDEDDTPLPSPTVSSPQLVPRTAPPPPPTGSAPPSRKGRASIDMPRGAPPQLPSQHQEDFEEEYDPYKHTAAPPQSSAPPPPPPHQPPPMTAERERRGSRSTASRQSQEGGLNRPAPGRRSVDQARPNTQHEYVAKEIDLAQNSGWWKIPNAVPPALRDRKDLSYEVEETTSTRRGGRTTVTRDIYVLYHDYSQTVITAQFERDDAENASFQQRHEQPPPQPRQDQLEEYASKFGAKLFNGAKNREGTVVGDGDPYSLVKDLFTLIPDALPSVGHRAFGALVYANLANASVQQFDEIRAGDIITFRNAKFQGHKGGLHQKYLVDVGKPEHVAVVLDWDGTKKKVRAWEQGREAKKVKVESFRVGDLRSGEVRIWRVVGRGWVGWEAQG